MLPCDPLGGHDAGASMVADVLRIPAPSEALRLREADFVPPLDLGGSFSLLLHADEHGETSKVGLTEESIALDSPDASWLGELLDRARTGAPPVCGARDVRLSEYMPHCFDSTIPQYNANFPLFKSSYFSILLPSLGKTPRREL